MLFYRKNYSQLWLKLTSSESLGLLDNTYLTDYYGNSNQITILHVASNTRFSVPMNKVVDKNPDVFIGFHPLSILPNGNYLIEARVRDIAGNYAILNEVANPIGNETIRAVGFSISDKEISVVEPSIVNITLGVEHKSPIVTKMFHTPKIITKLEINVPLTGRV